MKIIRTILILAVILILSLLAGDFINLPLWPIDFLKTNIPVEVRFELDDISNETAKRIFSNSRFCEIYLCKPKGDPIRSLSMDNEGFSRFVIREGHYSIEVLLASIDQSESYLYTNDSNNSFAIQKNMSEKTIPVQLVRKISISDESKQKILKVYLQEGDFAAARVLAENVSEQTRNDVDVLIKLSKETVSLPVDAYCSIIKRLRQISEILLRYNVLKEDQIILGENNVIHVNSHLEAILNARKIVIESYLVIMDEFNQSGRLMSVLQEWNQLTNNSELIVDRTDLPDSIVADLERFETIAMNVSKTLPDEIETNYNQGINLYDSGKLTEARKKLTRLLTFMNNLNLDDEYEETRLEVIEYLSNIELIAAANHAVRNNNLEHALQLFDLITKPNNLVRERQKETLNFLHIKNKQGISR